MPFTNQDRVGKAMELLRAGLAPLAEREFASLHQAQAAEAACRYAGDDRTIASKELEDWDVAAFLKLRWEAWNDVFGRTQGRAGHSMYRSGATEELDLWDGALALAEVERAEVPPFPMFGTDRAGAPLVRPQSSV
ncbi:MAG: Swt1 family HEPN domain-containing protein [Armatimonadota bacterium]|nr:Swt1 family HEPN domain-containing protein [Armatimonadota bacterium]